MGGSIHSPLYLHATAVLQFQLTLTSYLYCGRIFIPWQTSSASRVDKQEKRSPIPSSWGSLRSEIKAKVCKPCWKKWEGMRVMVINEYQVNLGEESGRDLVKKQMKAFLKLGRAN